jgi:hypothetical protein
MKITLDHCKLVLSCFVLLFILNNSALANYGQSDQTPPALGSISNMQTFSACRIRHYNVEYEVKDGERTVGDANRVLSSIDGVTSLYSRVDASIAFLTFSQTEKSILPNYQLKGLVSEQYTQVKKKPFKKAKTTSFSILQTNSVDDDLSAPIFDPLTVYDHLRELVCLGLREDVELKVQDGKNTEKFQFSFKGQESLQLPIGSVDAILMVRIRKKNSRETSIWFDVNRQFLPIKIEQKNDGDAQAKLVASSVKVDKEVNPLNGRKVN